MNAIGKKQRTIVVKILQFLLFSCEGNGCMATKEEIESICGNMNGNFTSWNKEHGRYNLLDKIGNHYKINDEVLENIQDLIPQLDY